MIQIESCGVEFGLRKPALVALTSNVRCYPCITKTMSCFAISLSSQPKWFNMVECIFHNKTVIYNLFSYHTDSKSYCNNSPSENRIKGYLYAHLIFEISSSKNLVQRIGLFVYLELDFCRLHRQ